MYELDNQLNSEYKDAQTKTTSSRLSVLWELLKAPETDLVVRYRASPVLV
jgi:hypothetical protein